MLLIESDTIRATPAYKVVPAFLGTELSMLLVAVAFTIVRSLKLPKELVSALLVSGALLYELVPTATAKRRCARSGVLRRCAEGLAFVRCLASS